MKTIYVLPGARIKTMDKLQEFLEDSAVLLSDRFSKKIIDLAADVMIEAYKAGKDITPEREKEWIKMERNLAESQNEWYNFEKEL